MGEEAGGPLAPGYVKDVRRLIQSFAEAGQCSLSDFKELWKSRGFSFIHEGCPKNVNPRRYQQILYSISLGFLQQYRLCRRKADAEQQQRQRQNDGQDFQGSRQQGGRGSTPGKGAAQRQVAFSADAGGLQRQEDAETVQSATVPQSTASAAAAAIYCIYCLYYTQHCSPLTLIYFSPEDLDAAELFAADTGVHHEAWEALLCLQRLDRENAFLYGAVPFNEKDVFGCTEEEAAARRSVLDKQLQVMKERLFSNLPIEDHLSTDLAKTLGVTVAERLGQQYEEALRAIPNPPAPSGRAGAGSQDGTGGRLGQERPLFAKEGELSKFLQPQE